ncbi:hypothetical protein PNQ29_12255 [Halobacterium salinarum]|uniref:hypothetical protein n=1 Tax=Halobacterium salinarum TaxID=2242 RepID=UPI0025526A87|nr:hypothetical protein [Halobacterium salinarum]MDL0120492.1 hypothetical protein [Halobacterium salinarum]
MSRAWVTSMSPNVEAVANPLAAACESGYIPDEIYILENPGLSDYLDRVTSMLERIVVEYGSDRPAIDITSLDSETEFERIVEHYRTPVIAAQDTDGMVAVDVTPGRKFMSAIAFQAGIKYDAEHVFYLYLSEGRFYGRIFPDVPNQALDLIDFQEVF